MEAAKLSNVDAEVEQGSSEETLEGVSNVSTKPFSDIVSCKLMQQLISKGSTNGDIARMCLLPCGDVVAVYQSENNIKLKLFEKDNFTNKLYFDIYNHITLTAIDIALFDRNRVAVAVTGTVEGNEMIEVNSIHLIIMSPNLEMSPEIKLKYKCEKIACFNNRMYCYSPDLKRSRFIPCPGIEILAMNGELLRTIQLFDTVSCFCPTKDGGITYFGSRKISGSIKKIFRSVTYDNTEVFNHLISDVMYKESKCILSDIKGNNIVFTSSGKGVLLNLDGSVKHVLLDATCMYVTGEEWHAFRGTGRPSRPTTIADIRRNPSSMCFSDDYNTVWAAGTIGARSTRKDFIYSFKIQYST